jgi:hypothetical protein
VFIFRYLNKFNFKYVALKILSILVRPLFLWYLVSQNISEANLFAQILFLNQILIYFTGTQIHKDYFDNIKSRRYEFRINSFTEGLILAPIAVLSLFFVNLFSVELILYILVITPFEKIIDDYQRELSYSGDNTKMAMVLFLRNLIIVLVFIFSLFFNINPLKLIIVIPIIYLILFKILKFKIFFLKILSLKIFKKMFKRILAFGIVGILWSISTSMVIQYDKIAFNLIGENFGEYFLRFQILQIAFISYTTLSFIPNRYLVLENKKLFEQSIRKFMPLYMLFLIILFIMTEMLSRYFLLIPIIDLKISILQTLILLLVLISHSYTEIIFWKFPLKKICIYEFSGFMLIISVIFILSFINISLSFLMTIILIYLFGRYLILLRCNSL